MVPLAAAEGATVVLGVNVDDLGDHRPGQQAAGERGAVFPLVDAGFTKAAVRSASRALGLRTWDKPAAACLASRIPYGTPVSLRTLDGVGRAEAALHRLGFRQVRVRHHGEVARIEFELDDLAAALSPAGRGRRRGQGRRLPLGGRRPRGLPLRQPQPADAPELDDSVRHSAASTAADSGAGLRRRTWPGGRRRSA